jgi:hypothetical protein
MTTEIIVVTGATGPPSERLEIKEFLKPENMKQFSLYVLALSKSWIV